MVIKVYVAGINSSAEIRSYQQRSQFILDSLRVDYESVDITDVGNEEIKEMIKEKCKHRNDQPPKTPQFFNDDIYCGDWFDFEMASDEDRVLEWLGLEDTREEVQDELPTGVKEIEGNEENDAEPSIKTEIKDGIITTETTTKEESIIFSNQNVKTAPISVRLDDSGKEIIEWKNENGEVEEENVLLENKMEIIRGDEEVVTRVVENKKGDENLENGDLNEENAVNGEQDDEQVQDEQEDEKEEEKAEDEQEDEKEEDEKAESAEENEEEANESGEDQSMEE